MLNTTITFHTGPDALGRRRFTLAWDDPAPAYGPTRRGQVFFTNPAPVIARYNPVLSDGP